LTQATIGADAWLALEFFPSRSYTADENHLASLTALPRLQMRKPKLQL
jgi:hypothetical protein